MRGKELRNDRSSFFLKPGLESQIDRSAIIWNYDGLVNKFLGDAVLALFNFPITRPDHARAAVRSALDTQKRCLEEAKKRPDAENQMCVGIGIHTGDAMVGEISATSKEFTAIGSVVNIAARLQAKAKPGQILMTQEVFEQVKDMFPNLVPPEMAIKGLERPLRVYTLEVGNPN